MKIAIDVSQVIYGTGVSRYITELVPALLRLGSDHQFVLFGGAIRGQAHLKMWLNRQKKATSITHLLPPQATNFLWNTLHLFPAENIVGKVDLIHTSDWAEPPSKIPKVTTVHDLSFFVDPTYTAAIVRKAQKKRLFWVKKESQAIIAVSQTTKDDLVKFLDFPAEKIDVIYEGPTIERPLTTDIAAVKAVLGRYGITLPYLFVPGCGHPRKNIARIVSAFKKLDLPHKLIITGRPTPTEASLASENILFPGFINDADLNLIFASADALIYPSLYEGFGLPILDAFVTNTPVLTSNLSSLPEAAGSAAILVDPSSTSSIRQGILKTLKQKPQLVLKGQQQLKNFSWEKAAKQTLKLYERVYNQVKTNS